LSQNDATISRFTETPFLHYSELIKMLFFSAANNSAANVNVCMLYRLLRWLRHETDCIK